MDYRIITKRVISCQCYGFICYCTQSLNVNVDAILEQRVFQTVQKIGSKILHKLESQECGDNVSRKNNNITEKHVQSRLCNYFAMEHYSSLLLYLPFDKKFYYDNIFYRPLIEVIVHLVRKFLRYLSFSAQKNLYSFISMISYFLFLVLQRSLFLACYIAMLILISLNKHVCGVSSQ